MLLSPHRNQTSCNPAAPHAPFPRPSSAQSAKSGSTSHPRTTRTTPFTPQTLTCSTATPLHHQEATSSTVSLPTAVHLQYGCCACTVADEQFEANDADGLTPFELAVVLGNYAMAGGLIHLQYGSDRPWEAARGVGEIRDSASDSDDGEDGRSTKRARHHRGMCIGFAPDSELKPHRANRDCPNNMCAAHCRVSGLFDCPIREHQSK
jgi:hypothetical protein